MYEDRGTLCPLMGGKPCMGADCACAVVRYAWAKWRCGLVSLNYANLEEANVIGFEHADKNEK